MKYHLLGVAAILFMATSHAHAQDAALLGDAEAGANVFKKCQSCHKVGPDAANSIGPVLNGIVGRAAGTVPGYHYSAATKDSGLVWDETTLKTYLHAPRKLVPGTKMTFSGLPKDKDIADVIAYLKQFDAQGQQANP
ncbi:MAG: cytochrome c family protein [Aestuariivirga sp.]